MGAIVYFGIDLYYFIWVIQLKRKLPISMSTFVSDAIFGYKNKMESELKKKLSAQQQKELEDEIKDLEGKEADADKQRLAAATAAKEEAAKNKANTAKPAGNVPPKAAAANKK
jgi:DNA-binding transcriptional MerR regulator